MSTGLLRPKPASRALNDVASVALEFGGLLMEAGSSARQAEEITIQVATGLGAEHIDTRLGYASLTVSVCANSETVTRMRKLGAFGVNQRLFHGLCAAAEQIGREGCTPAEARSQLQRIVCSSPHYPGWTVAAAVGIACAAFARLLGVDWAGLGPTLVASTLAQAVRRQFALRKVNVFISATLVAFIGATLAGLGSRWAGSDTIVSAMMATVLLLVPGVPFFNAQFDILEGRPTLGTARAVWIAVLLVFMTLGVWLAQGLIGEGR